MTDHFQETIDTLDGLEQRQRDEARSRANATQEPVTPEQRHEQFATELTARLRNVRSSWSTFTI
jgi:hypothetical protein